MDLFSKTEIIIMASVLGAVLLIVVLLTIFDFLDERKEKKKGKVLEVNNEEEKTLVEEHNEEVKVESTVTVTDIALDKPEIVEEIEVLDFNEPVIEMKQEIDNNVVNIEYNDTLIIDDDIEIKYDEIFKQEVKNDNVLVVSNFDDEKTKAKITLELLKEELENENLDYENTITNFELEQEENAIISYDELIKVSDKLYNQNESYQYDDGNEPITIDEVIKRFSDKELTFENTANYDKLNKVIDSDKKLVESFKHE